MTAPSKSRCSFLDRLQRKKKPKAPFGNCNHPEEETKADYNTCAATDHKSHSSDSSSVSEPSSPATLALNTDHRPEPLSSNPVPCAAIRVDTFGSHHSILPNPTRVNTASTEHTSARPPTPLNPGRSLTLHAFTNPSRETSPSPAPSTFQSPRLSPALRPPRIHRSEMQSSLSAIAVSQAEIKESVDRLRQQLVDITAEMDSLKEDLRGAVKEIATQFERTMGNVAAVREEMDTLHAEMVQGLEGLRQEVRRWQSWGAGSVLRNGLGLGVGGAEREEDEIKMEGEKEVD